MTYTADLRRGEDMRSERASFMTWYTSMILWYRELHVLSFRRVNWICSGTSDRRRTDVLLIVKLILVAKDCLDIVAFTRSFALDTSDTFRLGLSRSITFLGRDSL